MENKAKDPIEYCEENYPEMCSEFKKVQQEHYKLFCSKQMDYGPGNIAMGTDLKRQEDRLLSLKGITVRMNDKIQRLVNLTLRNSREPKNESLLDSFNDSGVYCVIAILVSRGKWGR
jgi:hypothetical protein